MKESTLHFLYCSRLIVLDKKWVPQVPNSSLYIRPTMIGTEPTLGLGPANQAKLFVILSPVGAYFGSHSKAVTLLCDPRYVRATPGGCGYTKMGSNYAPTLWVQKVSMLLSWTVAKMQTKSNFLNCVLSLPSSTFN